MNPPIMMLAPLGMRATIRPVDLVVTDLAVFSFANGRATLLETAPGVSKRQVIEATEAELSAPEQVPEMRI